MIKTIIKDIKKKKCVNGEACTTTTKQVRISACVVQDDMPKIKGKHLVFKASIAKIKTCLLIENGSEAKLIDKSFVHTQNIDTFKLTKRIKLKL